MRIARNMPKTRPAIIVFTQQDYTPLPVWLSLLTFNPLSLSPSPPPPKANRVAQELLVHKLRTLRIPDMHRNLQHRLSISLSK
ncbi:hypothetical protein RRG08_061807 [Elysia crispata]|uniref:Uncharacterized protein n=1 Tax=Elysia crispata TaxID=231223 RepID=A0AAE1E456_9GAST|nr:hypothetical protein RRG08_061807 [Elysia crispata]